MKFSKRPPLDRHAPRELLDPVQQHVPRLDGLLVLLRLLVRARRLDDVRHLVDLGVEAPDGNEARELAVHELHGDAERRGHRRERHRFIRLEELRVDQDAELADDEARVLRQVAVFQEQRLELGQHGEERRVLAVVEARDQRREVRQLFDDLQHLGPVDNLLLELGPRQREHVRDDGVEDELRVRAELDARERRDAALQLARRAVDVARHEEIRGLVDRQPVVPVPVAAVRRELLRLGELALGGRDVGEEERDADLVHDGVDPLARRDLRPVADQVAGRVGRVLGADARVEARGVEERVEDLHVALVFLGVVLLLA
mmetsp:Transcript_24049/g.72283  ORF Transcript_24049/g.72283 Transcript_24049/m.72283 type:complete len:316 (-) Transcript_24049:367-1314(-)